MSVKEENIVSDVEEEEDYTPPEIFAEPVNVSDKLIPVRSWEKYTAIYASFLDWRKTKEFDDFSENVLMEFFVEQSKKLKPSSLWSQYSMLKSTINVNQNIDIGTYKKLLSFLKRLSVGFKSKKSNVLTAEEVERFLTEAPDIKFLAMKVALIFGITGACRKDELVNIRMTDIEFHGRILLIKIRNSNAKTTRSFTIHGKFYDIVKKYTVLRPKYTHSDRFFLNYQNGKCTVQVIGKNKFGNMPKRIAEFLNLPDPNSYTGHSFRRTSAALLSVVGVNVTAMKRFKRCTTYAPAADINLSRPIDQIMPNETQTTDEITSSVTLEEITPDANPDIEILSPKLEDVDNEMNIEEVTSEKIDSTEEEKNEGPEITTPDKDSQTKDTPEQVTLESDSIEKDISNKNITIEITKSTNTDKIDVGPSTSVRIGNTGDDKNVGSNITIPGKNITLQFTNCTNVHIYFGK